MTLPASIKILTPDEETSLVEAMVSGDARARDRIVVAHIPLARKMAGAAAKRTGLSFDDLLSEAMMALVIAANNFELGHNIRFSTYGIRQIGWGLNDYIARNWSIVRPAIGSKNRMSIVNIAFSGMGSPDRELDRPTLTGESRGNLIPDDRDGAETVLLRRERERSLKAETEKLMRKCTPRERHVVRARILTDADDVPTLREIGDKFAVSHERVRQIECAALKKIRNAVTSDTLMLLREAV